MISGLDNGEQVVLGMMSSYPLRLGVLISYLWPCLILTVNVLLVLPAEGCKGRTILNATTGIITDGPKNYLMSVHCEWLIDGK